MSDKKPKKKKIVSIVKKAQIKRLRQERDDQIAKGSRRRDKRYWKDRGQEFKDDDDYTDKIITLEEKKKRKKKRKQAYLDWDESLATAEAEENQKKRKKRFQAQKQSAKMVSKIKVPTSLDYTRTQMREAENRKKRKKMHDN
jgi:hypothetical protein